MAATLLLDLFGIDTNGTVMLRLKSYSDCMMTPYISWDRCLGEVICTCIPPKRLILYLIDILCPALKSMGLFQFLLQIHWSTEQLFTFIIDKSADLELSRYFSESIECEKKKKRTMLITISRPKPRVFT